MPDWEGAKVASAGGGGNDGPSMTQDELTKVRELLCDAQIIAFLRAANKTKDKPTTVLIVNQALDNGRPLAGILCEDPAIYRPPRYRFIHTLSAELIGPNAYRIHFGGSSKNVGDGGTWCVKYADDGEVTILTVEDYWSK